MQNLKLRQDIFNLAKQGKKISTSRKGVRDITSGPLELIMTEDATQKITVNISNVAFVPFGKLSLEEAKNEGYKSIDELKKVLTNIYGPIRNEHIFTCIKWDKII